MKKNSKILEALKKILASFSSITTDKGLLKWNSDNELPEIGESVVIVSEDGDETTAEDGEYSADGNWLIKVENGVVVEIIDLNENKEEEMEEEETPDVKEEVLKDRAEELVDISEEDKSQEEKVEEVKDILEEIVEEVKKIEEESEPESEKMEEDDAMSLEERVAALEAQLAELAAKLAKIEAEPAAEPASEEYKKINKMSKVTNDEKFNNLNKKLNASW